MAKDKDTYSKEALKRAEKMFDLMQKSEKSAKKQSDLWGDVSQAFLGISSSDFFEKIPHTVAQTEMMKDALTDVSKVIKEISTEVDDNFANIILSMSEKQEKALTKSVENFAKHSPEMAHAITKAIESGNMSEFIDKFGAQGTEMFKKLVADKKGFGAFKKFFDDSPKKLLEAKSAADGLAKELAEGGKSAMTMNSAFEAMGKAIKNAMQFLRPEHIKDSLLEFDQVLATSQKNTSIAFKQNNEAMTELVNTTSRFGMDINQASEFMGKLGEGLRTTDFDTLAAAAKDMSAISTATGLSIDEVGELGSQMMLFGKSSKDVSKFAENTMKSAQNFGVSGKKIMSDITKNLPKFRQMGFQGGEESLKRMALQAERLGQNMDEIFDVAKRARSIEGSLDMAAQLQLAGGSFANINPMDLLAAARKGPEELQKILAQMGSDIGTFNEKTGQMDFSAVDVDRLQIAADATGMSIDSLQKQITKAAQTNQKTKLLPPGLFEGLSPEEQAFLTNSMKLGKEGQLIDVGVKGVDDLASLSQANIQAAMKDADTSKKSIEEQAEQNQSFQDSVKALKDGVMNLFTAFEPLIKYLTKQIQNFSSMLSEVGPEWKMAIMAGVGALALLFGPAKQFADGLMFGRGHKAALEGGGLFKNFFKGGGKGGGKIPGLETGGETSKQGGFFSGMAKELKLASKEGAKIDLKGIGYMAASIAILSLPLIGMTLIFSKLGGDFKQLIMFGLAIVELSAALWLASKASEKISIKGILFGSLAMGILGLAMIPFGMALEKMQGIKWETLGKMAAAIAGAALILGVMGAGPIPGFILLGALALAGAAGALYIFGAAIQEIAGGFQLLSGINWAGFMTMGVALMSVVPGLLMLGGAGIFALPGLFMMTGVLAGLAAVMVVLAPALSMASVSMIQMADGIERLKNSIKGLDVDKLESLAGASERMATASAIGGLANAINSFVGGGSSGGAAKEQTMRLEPITINLKLNGREIQREIVNSTAHLS